MKLFGAFILALPVAVQATYNCSLQASCFLLDIQQVSTKGFCPGTDCYFSVCLTLTFGYPYHCYKKKKTAFDHTCKFPTGQCLTNFPVSQATPVDEVSNKYKQCQNVPPGGMAKFVMMDADGKDPACTDPTQEYKVATKSGSGQYCKATCGAATSDCYPKGGPAHLNPCLWTIKAPKCSGGASACGDPHIKPWTGKGYSYHGEGDFVLARSVDFADGLGFELQMRTKIKDFFSFIETAAVRIGSSIFEISMGKFWIDGVEGSDENLPASISGYTLNAPYVKGKAGKKEAMVYKLDLNVNDFVEFYVYKQFISVEIRGSYKDFSGSVGLMGDYSTGDRIGRDGLTEIEDVIAFGAEWQVRATEEAVLFATRREPQFPAAPIMPSESAVSRQRNLQSQDKEFEAAAQAACADKSPEDFDFCVFDVMATGDVGMAGSW